MSGEIEFILRLGTALLIVILFFLFITYIGGESG